MTVLCNAPRACVPCFLYSMLDAVCMHWDLVCSDFQPFTVKLIRFFHFLYYHTGRRQGAATAQTTSLLSHTIYIMLVLSLLVVALLCNTFVSESLFNGCVLVSCTYIAAGAGFTLAWSGNCTVICGQC